jgi:hypothetical protein
MLKIETTKMVPKQNFYMLSKEDFASVCFYILEYLSCIGVMLPKFCKSLFVLLLHHDLGVTKIGMLNKSCSVSNPVVARKNFRS